MGMCGPGCNSGSACRGLCTGGVCACHLTYDKADFDATHNYPKEHKVFERLKNARKENTRLPPKLRAYKEVVSVMKGKRTKDLITGMSKKINTALADMTLNTLHSRETIRECRSAVNDICQKLELYRKEAEADGTAAGIVNSTTETIQNTKNLLAQILDANNNGNDNDAVINAIK